MSSLPYRLLIGNEEGSQIFYVEGVKNSTRTPTSGLLDTLRLQIFERIFERTNLKAMVRWLNADIIRSRGYTAVELQRQLSMDDLYHAKWTSVDLNKFEFSADILLAMSLTEEHLKDRKFLPVPFMLSVGLNWDKISANFPDLTANDLNCTPDELRRLGCPPSSVPRSQRQTPQPRVSREKVNY